MNKSRRMVKQLVSWLLVMTLVCTCTPISVNAAKKVKLNKTSIKLKVGKTVKLKLKNNKKKVKWSSANKKIATVNKSGLVKAKKKGKTRIIAKVKKKKYVCKVVVTAKSTSTSQSGSSNTGSGSPSGGDLTLSPTAVSSSEMPVPGSTMEPGSPSEPGSTTEPGSPSKPGNTTEPGSPSEPGNTTEPGSSSEPGSTTEPGSPSEPGNTTEPGSPSEPGNTTEPGSPSKPGNTTEPGSPSKPGSTTEPGSPSKPGSTTEPGSPSKPGNTTEPGSPSEPGSTMEPGSPSKPITTPVPENPGQEVTLPSDATVFTMGTKKLAIGMSKTDVDTALGASANQEIRTGKSPQGFDTIAYNTKDYSEYLLIYLQDNLVTGICGIGKTMSFGDAAAGKNGNNLSAEWGNLSAYRTNSGTTSAKKNTAASNETVYAFFDALGNNNIYCIQVFDSTKVRDADNDMIYTTSNLTYDATVTSSIATEIGCMLNAFRVYHSITWLYLNDGLAQCAQDYCDTITANKIDPRDADSLLYILLDYGVDPMNWGEVCYYDAADAISFANSLIEMDDFYNKMLMDSNKYRYIGVGMAAAGSHTYMAVDYVDEY